jgi:hypothetical protein
MQIFRESTDPKSLGNSFRQQRMNFFKGLLTDLPKPLRILDLGGNQVFWVNAGFHDHPDYEITILNLIPQPVRYSNLKSISGDATAMPEFDEGCFDLVFSNSVIEHLYSWENQEKMARESQRVGVKHFIQTPNRNFFMEPHYLLPFFQFLPRSMKYQVLVNTPLSRLKRWDKDLARQYVDEIRLLSLKEMKKLFPESHIWKEKFFGLNKSFVAHNFEI